MFPRTVDDFKELRRSAAEHQPELESAIHGVFLVEEKIPVDFEEDVKTKKVIQQSDLINQSKGKAYITEQEGDEFEKLDTEKAR